MGKVTRNPAELRFKRIGGAARDMRRDARGWAARGTCCGGNAVLVRYHCVTLRCAIGSRSKSKKTNSWKLPM